MLIALAALWPSTAAAKPAPLYWGGLIGSQYTGTAAPWDMNAVTAFERNTHKSPSLIEYLAPFSECVSKRCTFNYFPTVPMQHIRERGAIPFFSWATQSLPATTTNQPAFRLSKIANGAYDTYITAFAQQAKEWGHPFFLRFDWEMNGAWFPWGVGANHNTAADFVAAWRHVWRIFHRVGASNATWVWCPNIDLTGELARLRPLYPGSRYVDWTCVDGFNWGNTSRSAGWMSFNEVIRGTYERIVKIAPNKPLVIGETASEERGGSKAQWIRRMLDVIPQKYKKVRAVIWFDERDQGMDWPLESSKSSANAFAKGIAPSLYRPGIYSRLAKGKVKPPTWGPPPSEPSELPSAAGSEAP
jgi:beta-mannanase